MTDTNNTIYVSSQNNDEPWGIQVTGGDGKLGTPYTFKALFMDPTAPQVGSASLTLADDLGLNFYVKNIDADSLSSYSLKFTGKCDEDGQTVPLSQKTVEGQTIYNSGKYYITGRGIVTVTATAGGKSDFCIIDTSPADGIDPPTNFPVL